MLKLVPATVAAFALAASAALAQTPALPTIVGATPAGPSVVNTTVPAASATVVTTTPPSSTAIQSGTLALPTPTAPTTAPIPTTLPNPSVTMVDGSVVPVFGANLFTGAFASSRPGAMPSYVIQPGDQIAVRIYGAINSDAVTTVDPYGRLFIQGIGPVQVGGLLAQDLQGKVSGAVQNVYTNAVGVYSAIVNGGTLGVYVAGDVLRSGRYVGNPDDTLLYFLDQAGGIDPQRGSLRNISIRRGASIVARYDLYDFILRGVINSFRFQDGDVIVVGHRGSLVAAEGDVRNVNAFEAPPGAATISGRDLAALAVPLSTVTSASVGQAASGVRNATYFPIGQFPGVSLADGSAVNFHSELYTETISVSLQGDIKGQRVFSLPRGATLGQVLSQVNLEETDVVRDAIHIQRQAVANAQKDALNRSLDVLQREVLTEPVYGSDSAQAKTADVSAITQYIAAARQVQPDGNVAVYTDGSFHDMRLENGDTIVMPSRTDVVLVAGQVLSPGAYSHSANLTALDYVDNAGGFGANSNKKRIVFRHQDGSATVGDGKTHPHAGDQIVVLPKFGQGAALEIFKDLTQIMFQIATTAGVAVAIINK